MKRIILLTLISVLFVSPAMAWTGQDLVNTHKADDNTTNEYALSIGMIMGVATGINSTYQMKKEERFLCFPAGETYNDMLGVIAESVEEYNIAQDNAVDTIYISLITKYACDPKRIL